MTFRSAIRLAVLTACTSLLQPLEAMQGDAVVAVVENEVITVHDVHEFTAQEEERLRSQLPLEEQRPQIAELRRQAVGRLIERELVYAEFKKLGAKVPVEVVQDRLDRIIARRSGGDRVKFEDMLAAEGMTFADFEQQIRKQVAVDLLLNERVYRGINIGPQRIEAHYREQGASLVEKAGVRLQAIVLKKSDGRYSATLEATVGEIYGKLKAGTPFAELAKTYSEGPNADEGGDQGWITAPSGKLEQALAGLAPGDVTASAVDLGTRLYVIRLTERRAESMPALDNALRKRIEETLRKEEEVRRYDEFIKEIRGKYYVKTPDDFDGVK